MFFISFFFFFSAPITSVSVYLLTSSIAHGIVDPDIMVLRVHRLFNERLLEFLPVYSDMIVELKDNVLSLGGLLLLFPGEGGFLLLLGLLGAILQRERGVHLTNRTRSRPLLDFLLVFLRLRVPLVIFNVAHPIRLHLKPTES